MTLPDAKNAAREIAGADMHVVSYRNVWGFFGSSDRELQAVFITKDNASTERSGIFLDKGEEGRFTEYATGRSVPANAVFGKASASSSSSLAKPFSMRIPLFSQSAVRHLSPPLTE